MSSGNEIVPTDDPSVPRQGDAEAVVLLDAGFERTAKAHGIEKPQRHKYSRRSNEHLYQLQR